MDSFLAIITIILLIFVGVVTGYGIAETGITKKLCNSDKHYDFCKLEKTTYRIEIK